MLFAEKVDEKVDLKDSPVLLRTRKESKVPVFTSEFEDTELSADQTLTLTCNVSGLPRPQIKWFRYSAPSTTNSLLITTC